MAGCLKGASPMPRRALFIIIREGDGDGDGQGLTSEGRDRTEHAAIHHALRFARMITPHTCDFGRVTTVVQHVEHLVPWEAPVRVRSYQHWCEKNKQNSLSQPTLFLSFLCLRARHVPASQSPRLATHRFSCAGSTSATSAVVP